MFSVVRSQSRVVVVGQDDGVLSAWTAGRHAPMNSISCFVNDRYCHRQHHDTTVLPLLLLSLILVLHERDNRQFDSFLLNMRNLRYNPPTA